MAEYVEQRMEEMIPEVEELERCQLLSSEEVKELLKKRKHYEYKIQKRTKKKEDFLNYIGYESNLLQFIYIRRNSTGYQHKKGTIDQAIKARINRLYRILCLRWQSDVKLWLSHIKWLKKVSWNSSVSRVYMRMLQVHSKDERLWIAAAKFEFENGGADNGRQLMLRGLRFHPKSTLLHSEYVKFELLYVERILARQEVLKVKSNIKGVLGAEKDGQPSTEDKDKAGGSASEDETEENKAANEDKESDQTLNDDAEDKSKDPILSLAIVRLVIKSAVGAIKDPKFVLTLILLSRKFKFAGDIEQELLALLESEFHDHPVTVDTRARLKLASNSGSMRHRINMCMAIYEKGLKDNPSKELFGKCIDTILSLPNIAPNCLIHILKQLLRFFHLGEELGNLLTAEHFDYWLQVIDYRPTDDPDQTPRKAAFVDSVMEQALSQHPHHLKFWTFKLGRSVEVRPADKKKVPLGGLLDGEFGSSAMKRCLSALETAVTTIKELEIKHKKNPEEVCMPASANEMIRAVWVKFLSSMASLDQGPVARQALAKAAETEVKHGDLRMLLLEQSREVSLTEAREVYKKFATLPPFDYSLHKKMLEIEKGEKKVSADHVRQVYGHFTSQFGVKSTDAWLDWIAWEEEDGSASEVPRIVCRATATLGCPVQRDKFLTLRSLAQLKKR